MTGKMTGTDNGIHDNGNEISYASAMTMVNDLRPFFGFHGSVDSNSYDIKLIALQAGCKKHLDSPVEGEAHPNATGLSDASGTNA